MLSGIRYIYTSNVTNSVHYMGPALQSPDYPEEDTARSPKNVPDMIKLSFH